MKAYAFPSISRLSRISPFGKRRRLNGVFPVQGMNPYLAVSSLPTGDGIFYLNFYTFPRPATCFDPVYKVRLKFPLATHLIGKRNASILLPTFVVFGERRFSACYLREAHVNDCLRNSFDGLLAVEFLSR